MDIENYCGTTKHQFCFTRIESVFCLNLRVNNKLHSESKISRKSWATGKGKENVFQYFFIIQQAEDTTTGFTVVVDKPSWILLALHNSRVVSFRIADRVDRIRGFGFEFWRYKDSPIRLRWIRKGWRIESTAIALFFFFSFTLSVFSSREFPSSL